MLQNVTTWRLIEFVFVAVVALVFSGLASGVWIALSAVAGVVLLVLTTFIVHETVKKVVITGLIAWWCVTVGLTMLTAALPETIQLGFLTRMIATQVGVSERLHAPGALAKKERYDACSRTERVLYENKIVRIRQQIDKRVTANPDITDPLRLSYEAQLEQAEAALIAWRRKCGKGLELAMPNLAVPAIPPQEPWEWTVWTCLAVIALVGTTVARRGGWWLNGVSFIVGVAALGIIGLGVATRVDWQSAARQAPKPQWTFCANDRCAKRVDVHEFTAERVHLTAYYPQTTNVFLWERAGVQQWYYFFSPNQRVRPQDMGRLEILPKTINPEKKCARGYTWGAEGARHIKTTIKIGDCS